jgi:hypothetical protein
MINVLLNRVRQIIYLNHKFLQMPLQKATLLAFVHSLPIFAPNKNELMKKLFTLFIGILTLTFAANAQTVCVVDTANSVFGITPTDTTAPPIIRGVAYDTVGQIYVPTSYTIMYMGTPITATIHWLNIDSVNNFPTGISYARNSGTSDTIYGGQHQCFKLSGTTMDTVGTYNLNFYGHIHLTVLIYDTIVSLQQLSSFSGQGGPSFGYFLKVDGGAGIHDVGANFNSSLNVYPNPTSGKFDVSLSNIDAVNGEIAVMDMTGRRVYSQRLDAAGFYTTSIDLSRFAKGLYTVQVRTANGFAAKNISVE